MAYELVVSEDRVDLWSEVRLPFEPEGELRRMRDELRAALRQLRGLQLCARFAGAEGSRFDLENVLFYNVGCSAFRALASRRVRFERAFDVPPAPSGIARPWHHSYSASLPCLWQPGPTVARLSLSTPRPSLSVAALWLAGQQIRTESGSVSDRDPLFVRIHLKTPRPLNLTEVVKKLIDGVFCSLHSYAGEPSADLVSRISSAAGIAQDTVGAYLARPGPLGPVRYVWPFRTGLQWSPADDRVVAVDIDWAPGAGPGWRLNFDVHAAVFSAADQGSPC